LILAGGLVGGLTAWIAWNWGPAATFKRQQQQLSAMAERVRLPSGFHLIRIEKETNFGIPLLPNETHPGPWQIRVFEVRGAPSNAAQELSITLRDQGFAPSNSGNCSFEARGLGAIMLFRFLPEATSIARSPSCPESSWKQVYAWFIVQRV
jgi:hypothetical protein